MATYTLLLRDLVNSDNIEVFDFEYSFYDEQLKQNFENKFIEHFYGREIGFDTIGMFKQRLKAKLNLIMPLYVQRYKAFTKANNGDVNFLATKDLLETFNRENDTTSSLSQNMTMENTTKENDMPQSRVQSLDDGYLSFVSGNKNIGSESTNSSGNLNENTTLKSVGRMGTSSAATLLKKWYDVMINIDAEIINECEDLFMGVF